jgi:hypothetical protein
MTSLPYTLPADGDIERARSELREDVARRLEKICGGWSREEFEAIVDKVTDTTLKFADPAPDPRV